MTSKDRIDNAKVQEWIEKSARLCLCSSPLGTHAILHFYRIHYSDRYSDDDYEYRHVILPKPLFKMLPKTFFNPDNSGTLRLLDEKEWRGIGITQSLGWEHYEVHGEHASDILSRYVTHCYSQLSSCCST